jgi:hypothetical protein
MTEDEHAAGTEGNEDMKDLTSTPFGLIIAYLLPGVGGLYGLSYFSTELHGLLSRSFTVESNVGLVLILACVALAVGMQVNVLRWILFQKIICRREQLGAEDFKKLGSVVKVVDFRAAVDEYYRYHQFYGGVTIVLPILYCEWLRHAWSRLSGCMSVSSALVFVGIETATAWFGIYTYSAYVKLGKQILAGG